MNNLAVTHSLASTIHPLTHLTWKERLQYFEKQIYKPAWESDYITQSH